MSSTLLTALKGEKGDRGDTGPQGAQGPQGPLGNSTWGGVSGNIDDQTDLRNRLNSKVSVGAETDPVFQSWLNNLYSSSISVNTVYGTYFYGGTFYGDGSGLYNVGGSSSNPQYIYDSYYYTAIDGPYHTAYSDYYAAGNSAVFSWHSGYLDMMSHNVSNVLGIYGHDGMGSYWSIGQYGEATFQTLTLGTTTISESQLNSLLSLLV